MRRWAVRQIVAALAGVGGATVAAASGCGTVGGYDCGEILACDFIDEDGTNQGACEGTCVDVTFSGFRTEALLVWMGPESDDVECSDALREGVPGRDRVSEFGRFVAAPEPHPGCPACACTASACVLPAGLSVTSGYMCDEGPGETVTPFEAPSGWDGACVAPGAVPPASFGSFAIAPVTERPCEVVPAQVPLAGDAPGGRWRATVCDDTNEITCPGDGRCMVAEARLNPGWRRCILSEVDRNTDTDTDDVDCPTWGSIKGPTFSEKYVFWSAAEDTRTCTDCACTGTAPSRCEAIVSTFEDAACGDLVDSAVVGGNGVCHDAEPGSALGSMRAVWQVNEPGTCVASGGELVGEPRLAGRKTLCCLPEGT